MGGFETGRDSEPEKDKNLTEAVSYIYEDVKDIFSKDIKETKEKQGLMSSNFSNNNDNDDKDDSPPTILENVTDVAKAFMGFFGKANPLLGAAAGITATISGTSVAEQLEKVRKIDTPFDYNKVYNQYLETPKTGLVTIPSRAKTAAAFKGSLSNESMFVPTTLGSFTPPPSTATGYGAGTDETMFVPTPTGEPIQSLGRPTLKPKSMANMAEIFKKRKEEREAILKSERTNLIEELAMSESSNNYFAISKPTKGFDLHSGVSGIGTLKNKATQKIAIGRLQFIESRLKEYTKQTGKSTTGFLNNPTLQTEVEQWHIQDLEDFIKDNDLEKYYGQTMKGFVVDKDSIIAMAHLGGRTGTKNFLKSKGKGKTDKQDAYNTNLSDYGKKFSKAVPTRSDFLPGTIPEVRPYSKEEIFKSPYPVKRPTIDTTTQTSEVTTDNDDALPDEGEFFDLRSVPIDTLLDPSIYLFGTNDREEKIKILKQMGIIQSV